MTATEPKTLVFVYDREETQQTDRLDARVAICRAYAAEMNWDVAGQWVDRGDAATSERRPFWIGMVVAMRQEGQGRRIVCLVAAGTESRTTWSTALDCGSSLATSTARAWLSKTVRPLLRRPVPEMRPCAGSGLAESRYGRGRR